MNSIGEVNNQIIAEQSILGAVLLDNNVLDNITFLEERDFSVIKHQSIYNAIKYLDTKNKPADIVTISEAIGKFGNIEDIGGVSYLLELSESCPTTANVEYYARIVRSKAMEKRVKDLAETIAVLDRNEYESDEEYFSIIDALVQEMRPRDNGKMKSLQETRNDYFEHLKQKAEFIPTGYKQFDEWAHGLWRGWLFISAGRPSVGKTAMLLQRLHGVAKSGEGAVLLYSQEMDENQIKDRLIANASGVNYNRIKNKTLSEKEWFLVEEMYEKLEDLPIFIQDSSGVTIDEIRATARHFKRKYGKLAMIAVDYLQIMSIPQKKNETRAQAIGNVTRSAKQIAREMNCCFMMLSQMTRESEQKKKPQLSDLKESSSIEQDADVVEFLWHDPNDFDQNGKVIQQFIAKGRDVGINDFRLLFKGWKQQFEELSKSR